MKPQLTILLCLIFGLAAVLVSPPSEACTFVILPEKSRVKFQVKHSDYVKPVRGRFESLNGAIDYDAKQQTDAVQIDVTIDANSVDTDNRFRDGHLREAFLETHRFPEIHFRASSIDQENNLLHGEVTIKEVTRKIALKLMAVRVFTDHEGVYMLRCRAVGKVNRRDFGVAEDASRSEGLKKLIARIQEGLDEFIEDDVDILISVVARAT